MKRGCRDGNHRAELLQRNSFAAPGSRLKLLVENDISGTRIHLHRWAAAIDGSLQDAVSDVAGEWAGETRIDRARTGLDVQEKFRARVNVNLNIS
jgi:hypothetical protein